MDTPHRTISRGPGWIKLPLEGPCGRPFLAPGFRATSGDLAMDFRQHVLHMCTAGSIQADSAHGRADTVWSGYAPYHNGHRTLHLGLSGHGHQTFPNLRTCVYRRRSGSLYTGMYSLLPGVSQLRAASGRATETRSCTQSPRYAQGQGHSIVVTGRARTTRGVPADCQGHNQRSRVIAGSKHITRTVMNNSSWFIEL